jgi:hypothetical protein
MVIACSTGCKVKQRPGTGCLSVVEQDKIFVNMAEFHFMPEDSAVDSFRYALNPELVKLYVVTVLGWFIIDFSQGGFFIIPNPLLETLVSLVASLFGVALFLGGLVGVVHQVLSDSM